MSNRIFVTGIGTGVGKTITSAVLCEALAADYWKPIQAGDLHQTDSMTVRSLLSNPQSRIHPEQFLLQEPAAPYVAAAKEGLEIAADSFHFPGTEHKLLIEGAGGLFVPIRSQFFFIDFIEMNELPVVLVASAYLGAINHTFLSIEVLRKRNIHIAGLVLNGAGDSADFIEKSSGIPVILRLPTSEKIDQKWVREQAAKVRPFTF